MRTCLTGTSHTIAICRHHLHRDQPYNCNMQTPPSPRPAIQLQCADTTFTETSHTIAICRHHLHRDQPYNCNMQTPPSPRPAIQLQCADTTFPSSVKSQGAGGVSDTLFMFTSDIKLLYTNNKRTRHNQKLHSNTILNYTPPFTNPPT